VSQITRIPLPEKVPVLDHAGERMFWADAASARRLVLEKKAECLWSKRKVRALRLIGRGHDEFIKSGAARRRGLRYSHNRETADNPQGCWTLIHIPNSCRKVFTAVLDECKQAA
jgi:hypothetical protein